jgi:hypothetical protein
MMRRTLIAVVGILAVLAATPPAAAGQTDVAVPVKGVISTSSTGVPVGFTDDGLPLFEIFGFGTLSHLGSVTTHSIQVVDVAAGTIVGPDATITVEPSTTPKQALRGKEMPDALAHQPTHAVLHESYTATIGPGPTPTTISFTGHSVVTGDGVQMQLDFVGGFCFEAKRGFVSYTGTMTLTG